MPKPADEKPKPWKVPAVARGEVHRAALACAEAHASDPFAYGRAFAHMTRGIELPSDVLADALRRLGRSAA